MKVRLFVATLVAAILLAACGSSHHAARAVHRAGPAACAGYMTAYGCSAHSPTFGAPPAGPPRLTAPTSTPTVAMYDSVTVSVLPHGAAAYGGYLFGLFPTFRPLLTAFPSAAHVPIAPQAQPVYPTTVKRMVCLDVEPRDATPDEAGPWAAGERKLGLTPCIYSSLKNGMAASMQSLAHWLGAGWRRLVFLWDADWTGTPHLDAGFDATQWTDHWNNLNVDASVATRAFLGLKPPAPKLPVCFHKRESRSACKAVKTQITNSQRAASSSGRAYKARGCVILSQRVVWFGDQLKHHPKVKTASRKRALAASRKAYRKQDCRVFLGRESFFNERVIALRDAN